MNRIMTICAAAVLLLVTGTATAQRNKKSKENAAALQEFARLGKWNTRWPVEIHLHITHYVTPTVLASDSADTDMTLYYDLHTFYMEAEGMEQIANDSLLVMVNNNARMIRVFPGKGLRSYSQGNNPASFMPDTSVEKLSQRFVATLQSEEGGNNRVVLRSRDNIAGTGLKKEEVEVVYHAGNYQPVQYKQIKRSVAPVDSATYAGLASAEAWKGRLVTTTVKSGQLFFVVKETVTACRFNTIRYDQKTSPVQEHDRVVKTAGGEYQPAKSYGQYNISTD